MAADTGNGATLVLSGGFTSNYYMLGGTDQEGEAIEDSHLGTTTKKTKIPGDLYDAGQFDAEFEWKTNSIGPDLHSVQTATITFPVPSGLTNGATLAGTGFFIKRSTPELKNNQLQIGKLTWCWDGKSGPTYTAAS